MRLAPALNHLANPLLSRGSPHDWRTVLVIPKFWTTEEGVFTVGGHDGGMWLVDGVGRCVQVSQHCIAVPSANEFDDVGWHVTKEECHSAA
eukprot:5841408-Ditylum_brightwellii.AAC.1